MKYYDYFRTIDDICNNTNKPYQEAVDIVNNMVYKENKIESTNPNLKEETDERRFNHLQRQQYTILDKCINQCLGMPEKGKQSCEIYEPYQGVGCLWFYTIQQDYNVNRHDPKKRCTFSPEVIGYLMKRR